VLSLPVDAAPGSGSAKTACTDCHSSFAGVLPADHKPVKGDNLGVCLRCHEPDPTAPAEANAFSAGLHRAHAAKSVDVPCETCHVAQPEGKLGVAGGKVVLPVAAEDMARLRELESSWVTGPFLDAMHGRVDVDCAGCHGASAPGTEEVSNERCLACHGPMDKLIEKSKPAVHEDRNPHKSHLGEIACSVCHKGHEASQVYCLDCHKKFEMKMPEERVR
jgi:hypothetical protein